MHKISIVYLYIYGMIKRRMNGENIIHLGDLHPIIKMFIRIPKCYKYHIIREMIECGLLKQVGRNDFLVMPNPNRKALLDSLGNPLW